MEGCSLKFIVVSYSFFWAFQDSLFSYLIMKGIIYERELPEGVIMVEQIRHLFKTRITNQSV